jgi:Zn-dependent M16 (insulinase) family peptidase
MQPRPPPPTPQNQVNYVGKAANLYADAGYKLSGAAYVIEKYLGTSWLWDKVRVVGGAYGGFCSFDSHSGMFTYLSYRGERAGWRGRAAAALTPSLVSLTA